MSTYNVWRREHVDAFRADFPDLAHAKLEKKLLAAFKALDPSVRGPLEAAYRARSDAWKAACADWDARRARDRAAADAAAAAAPAARAAAADGDASDDGDAPPAPTAYPKAPDMWARDVKAEFRARHPDLSAPALVREMKRAWSATPEDDPVKRDYRARSAALKRQFAARFDAWNAKRFAGPRKKRRVRGPRSYDPEAIADWRSGAAPAADSNLSKAAHFSDDQRALFDARRALPRDDADALFLNAPAHETLARAFATDLWLQDAHAAGRGDAGPSQEILKHYYTKIANWLKRRA